MALQPGRDLLGAIAHLWAYCAGHRRRVSIQTWSSRLAQYAETLLRPANQPFENSIRWSSSISLLRSGDACMGSAWARCAVRARRARHCARFPQILTSTGLAQALRIALLYPFIW